jgi:hypothetical protein
VTRQVQACLYKCHRTWARSVALRTAFGSRCAASTETYVAFETTNAGLILVYIYA